MRKLAGTLALIAVLAGCSHTDPQEDARAKARALMEGYGMTEAQVDQMGAAWCARDADTSTRILTSAVSAERQESAATIADATFEAAYCPDGPSPTPR